MQLKFKKFWLLLTLFIYCFSFLLQSNFALFEIWAKEENIPRVNIVAVLVDDKIYNGISDGLKWYTVDYLQKNLSDTKALVIPIDFTNIHAYDIYRMMENIYFDGLEGANSSLIGLIMFGDIPLPVVNQNGYIFPTVYPYVDFENQKYVRDSGSEYFVPDGNPEGQAEIWHGLINYGTDTQAYLNFFNKIKKYKSNPDSFIGNKIWYEDIVSQKKGFLNENFSFYRNRVMFAEDLGYQRYSPLMKKIFRQEGTSNANDIVTELGDAVNIEFEGLEQAEQISNDGVDGMHTTKMVQQEIETSFLSDYSDLFSNISSSTMRENIFAAGRWIKEYTNSNGEKSMIMNADNSSAKIQMKDDIVLGNNDMQGLLENLNDLMEVMVDRKIQEKKLSMDIVVPVSYKEITGKKVWFSCYSFVERYENYYFGNAARSIDKAEDLSIYRGTYRNLSDLEGVTFSSLSKGNNATKSDYDSTDLKLRSIGGSYDIFSNQVEGNRGYNMYSVQDDYNVYMENRSQADSETSKQSRLGRVKKRSWPESCSDGECEGFDAFANRWWGGASATNLDSDALKNSGEYALSSYSASDSWRSIYDMGGFQSLKRGADEGMSGGGWRNGKGVGPQWAANSYKAYIKYASPTEREGWDTLKGGRRGKYEYYENHMPNVHRSFSSVDYFNLGGKVNRNYSLDSSDPKSMFVLRDRDSGKCGGDRYEYVYKVINSVVKHNSTTNEQINGIINDRYSENGTLGGYYHDIRIGYEDVKNNMDSILSGLADLKDSVSGGNAYINTKITNINAKVDGLSQGNTELSALQEQLSGLNAKFADMDEDDDEYEDTKKSIEETKNKINELSSGNEGSEDSIKSIINEISQLIKQEHASLEEVYDLVIGLYVENIISIMEFMIYLEGWNVEDYYDESKTNLNKIGFLSSWISEIKNIENYIKGKASVIRSDYSTVYSLVSKQQKAWGTLASKLKKESDNISDEVDKLTEEMDLIFKFIPDPEEIEKEKVSLKEQLDAGEISKDEYNDEISELEKGTELTSSTASEAMSTLYSDFNRVDKFFAKLITTDTIGAKIIDEAGKNNEFLKWLNGNHLVFKNLSDADKITEYSHWADEIGYKPDILQGVSQHVPGMNILTADRPIDSPRYVVMQSVAGNEMKFIYPDLFKVEVYKSIGNNKDGSEIHELLTQKEIRANLVKYINIKVSEYNSIIKNECKNAKSMDAYYNRLKDNFPLATPNKALHGCNETIFTKNDFVEALGGDEMLDVIAELLYYQSLTNKKKSSNGNIAKDIELIKNSFNVNDKREQILKDYLVEGTEKIKHPVLGIPTYEKLGYEVVYLNSDGKDYIFGSDNLQGNDSYSSNYDYDELLEGLDDSRNDQDGEGTLQENQLNDECNIPANGRLPLFEINGSSVSSPWYSGFKCWLKQTINEPLKVKITFDSSLGEMKVSDSIKDYLKGTDTAQVISEWGSSMDEYGDEWSSLLTKQTSKDSDNKITESQVNVENHNNEVTKGEDTNSKLLAKINDNVKISNSNSLLSDSNPTSELRIESSVSGVGMISVEFIGTGDSCIKIDGNSLCNGKTYQKNFDPKETPYLGEVSLASHVAGKIGLIIRMGIGGSSYIERVIKYTVSPGVLHKVDVKFGNKVAVAGILSPITIVGYDEYGNEVEWGLDDKYEFTVSQGKFWKDGSYKESFTTNDFRNLSFSYQAPLDAVDGTATVQVQSVWGGKVIGTGKISIVQASPVIKINGNTVLTGKDNLSVNQSYKLLSDEGVYTGGNLIVSKLQKIEINIANSNGKLVDFNGQVSVSSNNGLFTIGKVTKKSDGKYSFNKTSNFDLSGGKAIIYFYPKTIAGNDTISINIPGLASRTINYTVYPADGKKVQLKMENDYVELGGKAKFEVYVSDVWGNPTNGELTLISDSNYVEFPDLKQTRRDGDMIYNNISVKNGYLKTTIQGKGGGLTSIYVKEYPVTIEFKVDKHIFPESGLNVLYLNYFGNDWGNEWGYFSNNNKHVEMLMKNSNKIIATTTQLISESKIKKMIWKIEPGFQIKDSDNVGTVMLMKGKNVTLSIGGVHTMKSEFSSFKWMSVTQESMNTLLNNKNTMGDNYVFFVSSNTDYTINNGILYNSGEYIANLTNGELTLQLTDESLFNGDNIWSVVSNGINYGNLIVHFPNFVPKESDFEVLNRYLVNKVFSKGSSDIMSSIGIFDGMSEFKLDTNYKSIQDSSDAEERVGFIGDFKNITLFGEGEIVGEATKKFGSELLINLGDPVLSRKGKHNNVYGTDYDGGIGQEIYTDPESGIFGVYQIDFNNDGNEDWLVVYLDGRLKLAKNYGGSPDLRSMEELMRIAVRIQEVFVGDADGNGYEDIIILTENNQIRAYLNHGGMFDVDGNVACLNQDVFEGERSSTPSNLEGMNQFFVEDMNLDKVVDIVVYDAKGYIKVFYGGSTNGGPNYLSTGPYSSYACDEGWYDREVGNTVTVTSLGVQVSDENIFDNSMLYRVGLTGTDIMITTGNMSEFGINIGDDTLENLVTAKDLDNDGSLDNALSEIMASDKFDVGTASKKFVEQSAKYVDVTLYDNTLVGGGGSNNYVFVPSSFLDPKNNPDDHGSVWKNYYAQNGGKILIDGDIVKVRVTIKASDRYAFTGSFGDIIQGPWNVNYNGQGVIKGFKFIKGKAEYKRRDGNFSYIIDNITLKKGESLIFEYELEYHHVPLKQMSITHKTFWSDDNYPDIKLQSVDGCVKDFDGYVNAGKNKRSFVKKVVELQKQIDKEYEQEDANTKDYTEEMDNYGSDVSQIPGIVQDKIARKSLFGNMSTVLDMSVFDEQTKVIENAIDDVTKGMCNGFSFGGSSNCQGLPVPFNQAFLAPGKYHLFGCYNLPLGKLEKGLPVFHFPGTITTPIGALPFPWGLKSPLDGFIWAGGGVYPSFIRIYVAPTLTAQVGIAICLGPYAVGAALPSPFADLGGNCIVFAIKPQCKNSGEGGRKQDLENPNDVFEDFIEDVRDSGVCLQSQKGSQVTEQGHRSSPFNLFGDVSGGSNYQVDMDKSFLGVIELEMASFIGADNEPSDHSSIFIGDVDILGGEFTVNKIKGGMKQGLRSVLIDNWLDPQIRYIVNRLTKMHINVKLPDISDAVDEVQVIKDAVSNFSAVLNNEEESNQTPAIGSWSENNRDNWAQLNRTQANPFEALASLMNESKIINISVEPIDVKIPWIFQEDISAYNIYLQQWLEVNGKIVEGWGDVLETFYASCGKKETQKEKDTCYRDAEASLKSFIEFKNNDWEKLQNQIYSNILVLQKYRNFPFEVYEWVHVIDRYISEIMGLINNTFGYLSYWTSTNSQRFVGYIDSIVLILNIIKTYQILIDFSAEWGANCGTCSKDTYDQYSCKLSMLCNMIELPIIQIPNFKLPNITIDLSHIDLSLDIILPDFNFQPIGVDLPEIPNLPDVTFPGVGSISFNLKLPDIPVLPEPPELPELPSFIPEIEWSLPILPPAPELPKLPNEIESVMKAAKLIGKIYCIVKGKFGLVGESSVKAKIEQLTQRTYEVKWIDNITDLTNRSAAPVSSDGLDYEISSYVDLQYDFNSFYTFLDTVTKNINNLYVSSVDWVEDNIIDKSVELPTNFVDDQIEKVKQENDKVGNVINNMGKNIEFNATIGMADNGDTDLNVKGLLSDEIEYVDYSEAKSRLEDVLTYFVEETKDTTYGDTVKSSINKIENQINKVNKVEGNLKGLENSRDEIMGYLKDEKMFYDELADLINEDYDGFLAMVNEQNENTKSDIGDGKLLTFGVHLFDVDPSTKDVINTITKSNPYEILLNNKKTIVDGYRNAINSNTANDLGLSAEQYLVLHSNIGNIRNQVTTLYSVTKPISSTQLIAKNSRVATNKPLLSAASTTRLGSNMETADVVDPSVLSNGIYEKIVKGADAGKSTKVVYSDSFVSNIGNKYYSTTPDRGHDIVLWDEKTVYLKCVDQTCSTKGNGGYKGYYKSDTVKEIPYEERWISFDKDTKLKISDKNQEIKNWRVAGQSYDKLSFSWKIGDEDGYLIKLVERVDHSYEKADYSLIQTPVHYVLALPETVDIDDIYANNIQLELLKKTGKIKDLLDKELSEIVYYDSNKNIGDMVITNLDRKWYYMRIAALNLDNDTYSIDSPRSNQIVAGRQVVGDDKGPKGKPTLYRSSIKEIVSEGDELEGYVGTKYELIVNWTDNVALSYVSLSKDGKILDEKYTSNTGDSVSAIIDVHTGDTIEDYTVVGIDQFGNKTEKKISVHFAIPEITITDVLKNADGESVSIVAEISQDLDQGNISFQRKRGNVWKSILPKNVDDLNLSLSPGKVRVVGTPYSVGNEIAMYDKNGDVIALMDPNTAEIKLQSGYLDKVEINVSVKDSAVLYVYDKDKDSSLFSMSIPYEECKRIEAEGYTQADLPDNGKMGIFNGGKTIYKNGTNVLFISPNCHLYSEAGLDGTYDYDREIGAILLTLYEKSDFGKKYPIKIWVKVKPYIGS